MGSDQRKRRWMLTVPAEGDKGVSREELTTALDRYSAYLGQLEEGEGGYRHWQAVIDNGEPIRFGTLKRLLPTAHLEPVRSWPAAVAYVSKAESRVEGEPPLKKGTIEVKSPGQRTDLEDLRTMILESSEPVHRLLVEHEHAWKYPRMVGDLVAARDREKYGRDLREVRVRVIVGDTGTGKTRAALAGLQELGEVCRVTSWGPGAFDGYDGQPSIIFDEFAGQPSISELLTWLDVYPVDLPARYRSRPAAFTRVAILSNRGPWDWYPGAPAPVLTALARRLHMVEIWHSDGTIELLEPAELVRRMTEEEPGKAIISLAPLPAIA